MIDPQAEDEAYRQLSAKEKGYQIIKGKIGTISFDLTGPPHSIIAIKNFITNLVNMDGGKYHVTKDGAYESTDKKR